MLAHHRAIGIVVFAGIDVILGVKADLGHFQQGDGVGPVHGQGAHKSLLGALRVKQLHAAQAQVHKRQGAARVEAVLYHHLELLLRLLVALLGEQEGGKVVARPRELGVDLDSHLEVFLGEFVLAGALVHQGKRFIDVGVVGIYVVGQLQVALGGVPVPFPDILPRQGDALVQCLFGGVLLAENAFGCGNTTARQRQQRGDTDCSQD